MASCSAVAWRDTRIMPHSRSAARTAELTRTPESRYASGDGTGASARQATRRVRRSQDARPSSGQHVAVPPQDSDIVTSSLDQDEVARRAFAHLGIKGPLPRVRRRQNPAYSGRIDRLCGPIHTAVGALSAAGRLAYAMLSDFKTFLRARVDLAMMGMRARSVFVAMACAIILAPSA